MHIFEEKNKSVTYDSKFLCCNSYFGHPMLAIKKWHNVTIPPRPPFPIFTLIKIWYHSIWNYNEFTNQRIFWIFLIEVYFLSLLIPVQTKVWPVYGISLLLHILFLQGQSDSFGFGQNLFLQPLRGSYWYQTYHCSLCSKPKYIKAISYESFLSIT